MRVCAVIPSHNHHRALPAVVATLAAAGLPVLVIDDGSSEPARSAIARLHAPDRGTTVDRLEVNQGKGVAVCHGFRLAAAAGYSHVVQVDADGQHDLGQLSVLLAAADAYPQALVTGVPVYDHTIPMGRKIGRWVTHVWVWIETVSLHIRDSMCGFRVYPIAPVLELLANEPVGRRMDFDTEIMVRLFWRGVPVVQRPVRVIYPDDNHSNFDVVRDNVRISRMHARLFFTMLCHMPTILRSRPPDLDRPSVRADSGHWAKLPERGLLWGLRFVAGVYRWFGRPVCLLFLRPIVLYFFLSGRLQRRSSLAFLRRVAEVRGDSRRPGWWESYRHFLAFATQALDTFAAWAGGLPADCTVTEDQEMLARMAADPRGRLLLVSHLGAMELRRALMDDAVRARLVVLVHTRNAVLYNRVLRDIRPDAAINAIEVTELGVETAVQLQELIERGHWLAIAADRVPVGGPAHTVTVPFLGMPARFPAGPYRLAHLLDCPVDFAACVRDGPGFRFIVESVAERINLPARLREAAIAAWAGRFAQRLEALALCHPDQWYNFYDFWRK